jgi:integrase
METAATHYHPILGGKAYVFKRDESAYWYASAYLNGQKHRKSTKAEHLHDAIKFAEDWYIRLRGKASVGALKPPQEKTFREVATQFLKEYEVITEGQRSPRWVQGHGIRLRVHLLPFFGDLPISAVTSGKVQEYRVLRRTPPKEKNPHSKDNRRLNAKAPARKTLHNEIVTLRQVLKTAIRHNWLAALPDLSPPYKTQGKISHRAWFSPAEYKQLYEATRAWTKKAPKNLRWHAEQLHDYVLFMANTGLRPDEAKNLQHRDVEIVEDDATDQTILVIEVRGKRGVGYCKSTVGAVRPYERLLKRPKPRNEDDTSEPVLPELMDHVFPSSSVKMLNAILRRTKLKLDRDQNPRTAYSLRHTYICLRLMEGADIYQIAKNCRTSVEMIEKHYAAHIKTSLDAAAINVMKPRKKKKGEDREPDRDNAPDDDL